MGRPNKTKKTIFKVPGATPVKYVVPDDGREIVEITNLIFCERDYRINVEVVAYKERLGKREVSVVSKNWRWR